MTLCKINGKNHTPIVSIGRKLCRNCAGGDIFVENLLILKYIILIMRYVIHMTGAY